MKKKLESLIQEGSIDEATDLVQKASNYAEAEGLVSVVLRSEKPAPKLIEAVLQVFLERKENRYEMHGYWVHSLSHFSSQLWKLRLDSWIKKFNEVAFKGANELRDSNCSDRLVSDFSRFAKWDDDPADFHLTMENLVWMDWKYFQYAKARIEAGRFESEEAFLRWKLHRPETHIAFDGEAQTDLVNINKIRGLIKKLQELGVDVTEFSSLEKDLLVKRLNELESDLSKATQEWLRERIEKGIQKTRKALEE